MQLFQPPSFPVSFLGLSLCLLLASCEGSSIGSSLEKNLEPDPQLLESESTPTVEVAQPEPAPLPEPEPEASSEEASPEASADPTYADIDRAPEELQPYIRDLLALGLLSEPREDPDQAGSASPRQFKPNDAITRREYARWLLAANNRFYQSEGAKRIRPAVDSSTPVFQDVGSGNSDFPAIQGLAEAGIIPSSLNGNANAVKFRPDAPLTRKNLILWKTPLDSREPLPEASAQAVTEAWSFQDAGKIEPAVLGALLADYGNGEFANTRRALGYTTLFQPDKAVTRAEAAATLWRFGNRTEGITAPELEQPSESEQPEDSEDSTSQQLKSSPLGAVAQIPPEQRP